jgi:hypothetical protein
VISDFPSALVSSGTAPRIVFGESDREGQLFGLGFGLDRLDASVGHAQLAGES